MKILIVTHKLGKNYGGIMQAFALQTVITRLGNTVSVGHYENLLHRKIKHNVVYIVKVVLSVLGLRKYEIYDRGMYRSIYSQIDRFVNKYINSVNLVSAIGFVHRNRLSEFERIVVGSDQVWRKKYVSIPAYMMKYARPNSYIISYAASFGKDDISEYSQKLVKVSSRLLNKFKAISVRENTGVTLCEDKFSVSAVWHLDPVFLLGYKDYEELIEQSDSNTGAPRDLFVYVLDRSSINNRIIKSIAEKTELKPYEIIPHSPNSILQFIKNKVEYIRPGVTQWVRSFKDSEFIVTDSFHGTAFSIIFNKPFITIGNKNRGLARFASLLKLFGLEARLVTSVDDITDDLLNAEIDWRSVNNIIRREQKRSFNYLTTHLGKNDE